MLLLLLVAAAAAERALQDAAGHCRSGWVEDTWSSGYQASSKCLLTADNNGKGFDNKNQCRRHCQGVGGSLLTSRTTSKYRVICTCKMDKGPSQLDKALWDNSVDEPFNTLFPSHRVHLSYPGGGRAGGYPGVIPTGGIVLAEQILLRPTASWDTAGHAGLWTVIMPDVSLNNNDSNMQWMVTNIPGNNIEQGDEVMEYIPPIAWRNCWNGVDNHGRSCEGEKNGVIYERDYTHQTVFWVFKQQRKIKVEPGMRQSGCQVNAGSTFTPEGSPVWKYEDILRLMEVYSLTLHAGTFFRQPYSPMVDRILCQYHFCIGDLPFLAGAPGLTGITDGPECGPGGSPDPNGNAGMLDPIDWAQLNCRDCQTKGERQKKTTPAGRKLVETTKKRTYYFKPVKS